MHDIALQGTANFCGTQTSSLGGWAVARRFVCGMIRFNNLSSATMHDVRRPMPNLQEE